MIDKLKDVREEQAGTQVQSYFAKLAQLLKNAQKGVQKDYNSNFFSLWTFQNTLIHEAALKLYWNIQTMVNTTK